MTYKIKVNNVEIELTAEQIKEIKALPDESEFEYPLFMKHKVNGQIIMFTSINEGCVVWKRDQEFSSTIGYVSDGWIPHTNTDTWQPVPYDKERGIWHGQPVEVWDSMCTHERRIRFYNAITLSPFSIHGRSLLYTWDNIEAIPPEHYEPWMFEAYKTLEGI